MEVKRSLCHRLPKSIEVLIHLMYFETWVLTSGILTCEELHFMPQLTIPTWTPRPTATTGDPLSISQAKLVLSILCTQIWSSNSSLNFFFNLNSPVECNSSWHLSSLTTNIVVCCNLDGNSNESKFWKNKPHLLLPPNFTGNCEWTNNISFQHPRSLQFFPSRWRPHLFSHPPPDLAKGGWWVRPIPVWSFPPVWWAQCRVCCSHRNRNSGERWLFLPTSCAVQIRNRHLRPSRSFCADPDACGARNGLPLKSIFPWSTIRRKFSWSGSAGTAPPSRGIRWALRRLRYIFSLHVLVGLKRRGKIARVSHLMVNYHTQKYSAYLSGTTLRHLYHALMHTAPCTFGMPKIQVWSTINFEWWWCSQEVSWILLLVVVCQWKLKFSTAKIFQELLTSPPFPLKKTHLLHHL